ncbi:hypothetical protein GCM10010178_54490 [Lentzea flava]|uniref:Uncharacterized protein n=1 Tax=Lentzea flava TaxID=103732 RepID=A0ABQ2UXJ8_9PSEU|nr:hypothetical protein [Lentzea flava]GGU55168.1 hypothetical protein GCM10010178_54490 [Lentzea flava]
MLVAAAPGLALAVFVAGMTLPLYPGVGAVLAAVGCLAVLGVLGVGLTMTKVTEVVTHIKPLRVWAIVCGSGTYTSLSTLYTDYPEVNGLLTSVSSVVFTVVVVASTSLVLYAALEVEASVKAWGTVPPELPT